MNGSTTSHTGERLVFLVLMIQILKNSDEISLLQTIKALLCQGQIHLAYAEKHGELKTLYNSVCFVVLVQVNELQN